MAAAVFAWCALPRSGGGCARLVRVPASASGSAAGAAGAACSSARACGGIVGGRARGAAAGAGVGAAGAVVAAGAAAAAGAAREAAAPPAMWLMRGRAAAAGKNGKTGKRRVNKTPAHICKVDLLLRRQALFYCCATQRGRVKR